MSRHSFLSVRNLSSPYDSDLDDVRKGKGKREKGDPTLASGARSEVNYIDWWSDIKSFPFGSRLAVPGNVPSEQPHL